MTGLKQVISRRAILIGLGTAALTACNRRAPSAADVEKQVRYQIGQLVAGGEVPGAGLVVRRGGKIIFEHAAGFAQGLENPAGELTALTSGTKFRVASVSKLATALTAHRLAKEGKIDLDADISGAFETSLRHPEFPNSPVTLGHLLSHISGLADPEVYWMPAPGEIDALFTDQMWRPGHFGAPGKGFTYCNFGYGLIATLIERASGERFDKLAKRLVFDPLGLNCGFNWSGVPQPLKQNGATLYAWTPEGWTPQVDGAADLAKQDLPVLLEDGFALEKYVIGSNGTLFSPQGGLRANLADLAVLVRAAAAEPRLANVIWRFDTDAQNGETDAGYFESYGEGAQVHNSERSPLPGEALIGHHGEAYGLYCGAWVLPARDVEIVYAVTGSPEGQAERSGLHPAANIYTAPLFMAAAQALRL